MRPPKRFRIVAKAWSIKEVGHRINSLLQKKAGVGSAGGSVAWSTPALQKKGKRKGEGGRGRKATLDCGNDAQRGF